MSWPPSPFFEELHDNSDSRPVFHSNAGSLTMKVSWKPTWLQILLMQHFYFSCCKTVEPLPLFVAFGLICIAEEGMMFTFTKESATRILQCYQKLQYYFTLWWKEKKRVLCLTIKWLWKRKSWIMLVQLLLLTSNPSDFSYQFLL